MRKLRLAFISLVLSSPAAFAQSAADSAVPTIPADQQSPVPAFSPYAFLATAAAANAFEIDSAKLALTKAEDPAVKTFAQQMLEAHEKAQAEMLAAAKEDQVEIAKPSMDGEQDGMMGKLEAADGAAFDQVYIATQLAVHQRAVPLFEGYQGSDTALRRYVTSALPMLVAHRDEVQALADRLIPPGTTP